ncbi:MAG: SOS response-associated peptidase [Alphaproteobacteria bacterium]|nr:SOS response-associated peptidase [Alphaproteobacteria bacterium]
MLTLPTEVVRRLFDLDERPNLQARYNIAPTQDAPVVRLAHGGARRELRLMRWGLVPSWAKDIKLGARHINARAETAATVPAFRGAFAQHRCLVPADGFYEWLKSDKARRPFRIGLKGFALFAFAGLWERWRQPGGGDTVRSFSILTTASSPGLAWLHDRMPVILDPADHAAWLDPAAPASAVAALLRPYPEDRFEWYEVGPRVNKHDNDDPRVLLPAVQGTLF